jgi:uncharacterized protein (DUF362 family)
MLIEVRDFRRTLSLGSKLGARQVTNRRSLQACVTFDFGEHSLLEELDDDAERFRVAMYSHKEMFASHCRGRHVYILAREAMEADVIISVPKLKCHKKAGVTGAIKNMVGACANKECLPHHRLGSPVESGDCYEHKSRLKGLTESLMDVINRDTSSAKSRLLAMPTRLFGYLVRQSAGDGNIDGAWHGNDTLWRTVIDLQRLLHYGTAEGSIAESPQRTILTLTDAIVGGDKEGPLDPSPCPSGFLTGAVNVAAADWVNAQLMGIDPRRIPIIDRCFGEFLYPLASFARSSIHVRGEVGEISGDDLGALRGRTYDPPSGWKGTCELRAPAGAGVSR